MMASKGSDEKDVIAFIAHHSSEDGALLGSQYTVFRSYRIDVILLILSYFI